MSKSSLPKELAAVIAEARTAWKAVPDAKEQLAAAQAEHQKLVDERERIIKDISVPAATVAKRVPELDILIERTAAAINPCGPGDTQCQADLASRRAAPLMADALYNLRHHFRWERIEALIADFRTWAGDVEVPKLTIWEYAANAAGCCEIDALPAFSANMDFTHAEENFQAVATYLEKHASELGSANARMEERNRLIREIERRCLSALIHDCQWIDYQLPPLR